jgi:hypothetical protein
VTTSPNPPTTVAPPRTPLRLELDASSDSRHGTWWPQSRDLQTEAADLVDNFPPHAGYIDRLLISRPDWDDSATEGRGVRRIQARRGPVKIGSFPGDDTHLTVLSMSTGERLNLEVIPSATGAAEGARLMRGIRPAGTVPSTAVGPDMTTDTARWDNESPGS